MYSSTSLLDLDLQPGKPPMLRVDATRDGPGWAAEHRDALRAVVAEHGCVLVRGLGLRDAAETGAVFQRLATGLMTEKDIGPQGSTSLHDQGLMGEWSPVRVTHGSKD
jgi:hypothetical protein